MVDGERIETGNFTSYQVTDGRQEVDDDGAPIVRETTSYEYRFNEETGEMLGGSDSWCDYNHLRCQSVVSTVTTVDTDSGNFTELTSETGCFPKCVCISHWSCRCKWRDNCAVYSSSQDLGWGIETTYYSVTDPVAVFLGIPWLKAMAEGTIAYFTFRHQP